MSVKKQYLKSRPACKVTFKLPGDALTNVDKVQLIGEFNNWDMKVLPMKKLKSGDFTETLELETGREYQYRFLINGQDWITDSEADKLIPNSFFSDNSVIVI